MYTYVYTLHVRTSVPKFRAGMGFGARVLSLSADLHLAMPFLFGFVVVLG